MLVLKKDAIARKDSWFGGSLFRHPFVKSQTVSNDYGNVPRPPTDMDDESIIIFLCNTVIHRSSLISSYALILHLT